MFNWFHQSSKMNFSTVAIDDYGKNSIVKDPTRGSAIKQDLKKQSDMIGIHPIVVNVFGYDNYHGNHIILCEII